MTKAPTFFTTALAFWVLSCHLCPGAVSPADSAPTDPTITLWLFDEPEYLNATLTDASENFYDLRLYPAGRLVPGRFGLAVSRRSADEGQAVSYAEDWNTFDNDWEGSLKDRPAKAPARLIETLRQGDWTWEFWLKLDHAPKAEACLIEAGEGVFSCRLSPEAGGFVVDSTLVPLRVLAPCDKGVWDGAWHHLAFTYRRDRKTLGCFLDGAPQPAARELPAAPPLSPETVFIRACGSGLDGQIFSEPDFTRPYVRQVNAQIDFDIGNKLGSGWSKRWQGFLKAPVSGRLNLSADTLYGVRLRLGEATVIDALGAGTNRSGGAEVVQGKFYPLCLDYVNRGPNARMRLLWNWDGHAEEVVPASAFYHAVTNLEPRFDLALLSDQLGEDPCPAALDEMRVSSGIRYDGPFKAPGTFSRKTRDAAPANASPALPLLFDGAPSGGPVNLGSRKHLFLDDALIGSSERVTFEQCGPLRIDETALHGLGDASVIDTGEHVRLYYGGWMSGVNLIESRDGLKFESPRTVWRVPGQANFFVDTRPGTRASERYKGIAFIMTRGLYALSSPDGVRWTRNENMLLPFDCGGGVEPCVDDQLGRYVCHIRVEGHYARGLSGGGRISARAESEDFFAPWQFTPDPQPVPRKAFTLPAIYQELPWGFGPNASGEVYRSRAIKYPWAPDAYLSFVWRFTPKTAEREEMTQTDLGVSRNGHDWHFFGIDLAFLPVGLKLPGGKAAKFAACSLGLVRRGDDLWQYADLRETSTPGRGCQSRPPGASPRRIRRHEGRRGAGLGSDPASQLRGQPTCAQRVGGGGAAGRNPE